MKNLLRKIKLNTLIPISFSKEEQELIDLLEINFSETVEFTIGIFHYYMYCGKCIFEYDERFPKNLWILNENIIKKLKRYSNSDVCKDFIKDIIIYYTGYKNIDFIDLHYSEISHIEKEYRNKCAKKIIENIGSTLRFGC